MLQGVFDTEDQIAPVINTLLQDSRFKVTHMSEIHLCNDSAELSGLQRCMLLLGIMLAWKLDPLWCILADSMLGAFMSSAFAFVTRPSAPQACKSCHQQHHISRCVLHLHCLK